MSTIVRAFADAFTKAAGNPVVRNELWKHTASDALPLVRFLPGLPNHAGWHGTTEERLREQAEKGAFEDRDMKIYVGDKVTAKNYAERRASLNNETPVVVAIGSNSKPVANEWYTPHASYSCSGGLGMYNYFPRGSQVKIYGAYSPADVPKSRLVAGVKAVINALKSNQ